MKIRTSEELIDLLNSDLAWRRKELTTLLNEVNTAPVKKIETALRSATLLLYAHWEGFVKSASLNYLIFVKSQKLMLKELDTCFVALALKQKLLNFESTHKSTIHTQVVNYLLYSLADRARISEDNVIKTNSNLNYSTLEELLTTIGIDSRPFELKKNLIDTQLVNYRNNIAHGQSLLVDKSEYQIIHHEIIEIINEINNRIQNAAVNQSFKIKPSEFVE